ncbi:uncharacterized protein [Pocillopora verrucosa]|uniref:uncharacterized protein n=1 Tax=Pocillopora verrucosa TaxID=203993 RepID=UPI00334152F9
MTTENAIKGANKCWKKGKKGKKRLNPTHLTEKTSNLCQDPKDCQVSFKPLGCFKDKSHARALPHYIYNERDDSIANYGGQKIDWNDWENYLPGFICRCAKKAKDLGYDLFGMQHFGECYAGSSSSDQYNRYGPGQCKDCVGTDMNDCNGRKFCVGKEWRNMVYKIVDLCSVRFERIGCFHDNKEAPRLLPSYLLNDRDENLPNFSGHLIDWKNWYEYLPDLVCRCAKKTKEKGWKLFGIQFWGECWSGPDDSVFYIEGHAQPGRCEDQCFNDCACSTRFCAGKNFTNAVYAITEQRIDEGSAMPDKVNILG